MLHISNPTKDSVHLILQDKIKMFSLAEFQVVKMVDKYHVIGYVREKNTDLNPKYNFEHLCTLPEWYGALTMATIRILLLADTVFNDPVENDQITCTEISH